MDRLQIANKIEADARQFYKRYTAGLEILDDDLRMLMGFGVHLHNTAPETESAVKAERKRIATALFEQVLKFNTDERHDDVDPCLVCDILEATSEIWTGLRGEK